MSFRRNYVSSAHFAETTSKKELCSILGERPIDIENLAKFTMRITLPCNFRCIVWKLLLSISPRFTDSQEFVHEQHVLIYQDTFDALKALQLAFPIIRKDCSQNGNLKLGTEKTLRLSSWKHCKHFVDSKNPELEHIFLMWLISEAKLQRNPETQLNLPENQRYIQIGHKIYSLLDDPVDIFHLCCSLWSFLRENETKIKSYVSLASESLRKRNSVLHRHLSCIGFFSDPILEDLGLSLFIDIFPDSPIEKIIDKIFAGTFAILSVLIVEMICQLKDTLFSLTSVESIKNVLYQMRKEKADAILNATLDEWHKNQPKP